MAFNFCFAGVVVLTVWLAWLFSGDNQWTTANQARWSADMRCDERSDRTDGSEICLAAFLLYGSPMMLTGACVFLALTLWLLSASLDKRAARSASQNVQVATRALGLAVVMAGLGMYAAASIGGAGMRLSQAVIAMMGVALFGVGMIVVSSIGMQAINQSIQNSPFVLKMYSIFSSDIIHGLAICCCTPPFVFFLALSFFNMRVRLWKSKLP